MDKNGKQDSELLLRALSETIRARRRTLKISQEDLSTSAGFARGYLSDIERGARSFSVKNLARLAQSLSLSPSALVNLAERRIADTDTPLGATLDLKVVSALIGNNGTSLLVIDPNQDDKPVMYVSSAFEGQFGYTRDEVIGKNFWFLPKLYPGEETKLIPCPIVTATFYEEQLAKAEKAAALIGSKVTPNKTFGKTGGEWLCSDGGLEMVGHTYRIDHTYQWADIWREHLYGTTVTA